MLCSNYYNNDKEEGTNFFERQRAYTKKTSYEESRSRSLLSLTRLLIIIIVAPGRPNRFFKHPVSHD